MPDTNWLPLVKNKKLTNFFFDGKKLTKSYWKYVLYQKIGQIILEIPLTKQFVLNPVSLSLFFLGFFL